MAVKQGLFPSWTGVIERLSAKLRQEKDEDSSEIVDRMLRKGRLIDAAGEAFRELHPHQFYEVLRGIFQVERPQDADLRLHDAVWRLSKLVVTTNYDDALRWSNPRARRFLNHQVHELAGLLSHSPKNDHAVWHLHGAIDDVGSLILAPREYKALYQATAESKYRAALQQLASLTASRQFLFIGFGLEDEYVLKMLEDVLGYFEGGLPQSYALLCDKSVSRDRVSALWEKYNIRVVSFADYGEPLIHVLQSITPANLQTQTQLPIRASSIGPLISQEIQKYPGVRVLRHSYTENKLPGLIETLEGSFAFRWEPGTVALNKPPMVYWPVRARDPGAIHAVQSFAAAALQKKGATIALCLDDYGDTKYDPDSFRRRIAEWFVVMGADPYAIQHELFSKLLGQEDRTLAWDHVRKWLGELRYPMDKVLKISKLLKPEMTLEDLLKRTTGRLLTPAVVWACLRYLRNLSPDSPIITLGGHDERSLWQAWRACGHSATGSVGHLYIPELSGVHMDEVNLAWTSKEDIRNTCRSQLDAANGAADWKNENSIIKWCITECVLLPEFVAGSQQHVCVAEIMSSANAEDIIHPLAADIAKWMGV